MEGRASRSLPTNLGALWLYSLLGGSGSEGSSALSQTSSQAGVSPVRPRANGRIAFLAGWRTNATPWFRIDTIRPDGSGRQTHARCTGPQSTCSYGAFAWSLDGRRFAFERGAHVCCAPKGEHPNVHLFVVKADGSGENRIPGCGPPWLSCANFAWAPDSRRIAFARSGSLFVVDTRSGRPLRITRSLSCCTGGPFWSRRGRTIVFATPRGIYRVNADGTGLAKLADGQNPSWSPDGRQIAFEMGNSISTMNADGSDSTRLFSAGSGPNGTSPTNPGLVTGRTADRIREDTGHDSRQAWRLRV
jgi:hypothetical protein